MLYQAEIGKFGIGESCDKLVAEFNLAEDVAQFVREIASGVYQHRAEIDDLINRFSIDWPVNRLASIDRNILRIAVYELSYQEDVPVSVAINEAVELAKKYGDGTSPKFVNGILGSIFRQGAVRVGHEGAGD